LPYPVRPRNLSMEDRWRCIYENAADGEVVKLSICLKTRHFVAASQPVLPIESRPTDVAEFCPSRLPSVSYVVKAHDAARVGLR
jgi:hypothetical protein